MVNDKLSKIVIETFGLDMERVDPSLGIGSVKKWDSLGHLKLVMAVEGAFNVRFSTQEIPELKTVEKIQDVLRFKGALNE